MTGEQIYAKFRIYFPNLLYELKSFKRTDPHTIELKTRGGGTYIFVYEGEGRFMLKTGTFKGN